MSYRLRANKNANFIHIVKILKVAPIFILLKDAHSSLIVDTETVVSTNMRLADSKKNVTEQTAHTLIHSKRKILLRR